MHVYHYAPYEPTALKRLMGRYGTREAEVDRLLREGVMVDLLRVVRQSLRASVESYSIKKMEAFYGFVREIDLRDAGLEHRRLRAVARAGRGRTARVEPPRADRALQPRRRRQQPPAARLARGPARRARRGRPGSTCRARSPGSRQLPADLTESAGPRPGAGRAPGRTRGRADRPGRPDAVAAGDLAARPAARLASPRGQVDVVGVPPADGPDARAARRRGRPDRPARAGRRRSMTCGRASRPGATGSRPRTTTSGAARSTTRRKKQARPDDSPFTWAVGEVAAIDPASAHRGPEAVGRRAASARDRPAQLGPDDGPPGGAARPRAHGSPTTGSRRPGRPARLATCSSACRRASASGSTSRSVAPDETDLEAARRLALGARPHDARDPGTARLGQDLHRRPDDLRAAGRRQAGRASPATSHKVIGNLLKAVLEAAAIEGVDGPAGPEGRRRTQVLDDPRVTRGKDATDVRARLDDGRANVAAGTSWLWASPKMAESVDVLFVDEAGQISLANVVAMAARHRQPRPARRPAAARPAAPGHPSAGRRPVGPRARPRRRRDDAARPRACSSRTPGGSTRTCATFTSEVFYDDRLEPEPTPRAPAGQRRRGHRRRDRAAAARRCRRRGRQRVPGRGGGGGGARPRDRRGRHDLAGPTGRQPSRRLGGRPDRGAVQRPGRRDPAPPAAGRAGRDGRQVPGPGGADQHLLDGDVVSPSSRRAAWTSCTAATASTSRPRGPAAWPSLVASPDLLRVRARTPEQMRLANAFCRFVEIARRRRSGRLDGPARAGVRPT